MIINDLFQINGRIIQNNFEPIDSKYDKITKNDTSKKEKQLKILKVNGTKKQQQQTWNIDTLTEWLIDGKNERQTDGRTKVLYL